MARSPLLDRLLGAAAAFACLAAMLAVPTAAADYRLPLTDGKVSTAQLVRSVGGELGVPALPFSGADVDLTGDRGAAFCRTLDDALWPACHASVAGGALVVRLDSAALPHDAAAVRRAARLLALGTVARPAGRYGLVLPERYDPARPVVVLIHGLDSDNSMWGSMVDLLQADGQQVGSFSYPDDGPVAEAGLLLADAFADLRLAHPGAAPARVVAHSMGGLVARHYVEGPAFRGGIDRLVMLGTPNHGSTWTGWRWATEWHSQYKTCRREGNWTWSRLSEDGNGEAADDLKPKSAFLKDLNARPRAPGVRYTSVAGDRSAIREVAADWFACSADCVPDRVSGWWGFRQTKGCLADKAKSLHETEAVNDGPVTLKSCRLDGVDDFVVVHADHTGLACGNPPAAWSVVRERLK